MPADGQGVVQDFKLKALAGNDVTQKAVAGGDVVVVNTGRVIRKYDGGSSGGSMYIVAAHLMMIGALAAMFVCQGTGIMQQKQRQ